MTLLVDGGVLEVADEVRVRGGVERRNRLSWTRATIDRERAEAMSPEEHREVFIAGISPLLAEFEAYLALGCASARPGALLLRATLIWFALGPRPVCLGAPRRLLGDARLHGGLSVLPR